MKRMAPILMAVVLVAAAAAARAMNLMPLLQDTPAQLFTIQDYEFFDAALRRALDEMRRDGVVPWSNPETRAGGSVTVVREHQRGGSACKRLRIDNHANSRKGYSTFDFCREADGRWVLAPMDR